MKHLNILLILGALCPFLAQAQMVLVDRQAPDIEENFIFFTQNQEIAKVPVLNAVQKTQTLEINSEELQENPALLRALMIKMVQENHLQGMKKLLPLYKKLPDADPILIHHAQGVIDLQERRIKEAIQAFSEILKVHPDSEVALFYLSLATWQNKDYTQAERYLEALDNYNLPNDIRQLREDYLKNLSQMKKGQWQMAFNLFYDKNVNQAPEERYFGNFVFEAPKKDIGLFYHVNYQKRFFLEKGWQIAPNAHLFGKIYRKESDYNDANIYLSVPIIHANAKREWQIAPFFLRRYFANRSYSYHAGIDAQNEYQLNQKWALGAGVRYEKSWHDGRAFFNHRRRSLRVMAKFSPSYHQQFFLQGQLSWQDQSRDLDDQFREQQIKGVWQGIWQDKFKTTFSAQYSQRNYYTGNLLTGVDHPRKDHNLNLQLALQHRDIHWKGITPTLNLNYNRHNSNSALHRYKKSEVFVSFYKSFF